MTKNYSYEDQATKPSPSPVGRCRPTPVGYEDPPSVCPTPQSPVTTGIPRQED